MGLKTIQSFFSHASLRNLERYIAVNEKSENKFTKYVVCFGSQPAVFTAEIVDPWNDEDQGDFTREEYKNISNQDHPRKLRGINFAGDINFQNIEDAKKQAENEIVPVCTIPEPLDETSIFI